MKNTTSQINLSDDFYASCQKWIPDEPAKGAVVLIHGLGEHTGRYDHVGRFLSERGFLLVAFDLPGHGKTQGKRGDFPSIEITHRGIDIGIQEARKSIGEKPIFLYGHSLGGLIALHYTVTKKPDVVGVVASAPALKSPLQEQKLKVLLVKTLGSVLPGMQMPSGLNPYHLSRNNELVNSYISDPLVHDKVTLGAAKMFLNMVNETYEKAGSASVPILLMHGGEDKITYVSGSKSFLEAAPPNCSLKIWENLFHEIHNESEAEQVLQFCVDWMEARISESRPSFKII